MGLSGSVFTNIMLDGDTLVATGIGITEPPEQAQVIVFAKLDTNGNVLLKTIVEDSLGASYTPEYPRGFLKMQDGSGYVLLCHVFERKNGIVLKLDKDGNLLWVKEYEDEESRQDHYEAILEVEGGFFITGSKQAQDYSNNLFVMKTDRFGNKLWERAYGENNDRRDSFGKIFKESSNEFIIGGSTGSNQNVPWQEWQWTIQVFAIDSIGNEKWSWESDLSLEEVLINGLHQTDNGYWAYTTAKIEFDLDGSMRGQPKFVIRDNNFEIVEEKIMDEPDFQYNFFVDMIRLSNGDWFSFGINTEEVDNPQGADLHAYAWMVRMDEYGDTLWTRKDLVLPDTSQFGTFQMLHSAVELPSGNIIVAGYLEAFISSSLANLGVLIKVDRNGNLLDCLYVGTDEAWNNIMPQVTIYPNPATDNLFIKMPELLITQSQWFALRYIWPSCIICLTGKREWGV